MANKQANVYPLINHIAHMHISKHITLNEQMEHIAHTSPAGTQTKAPSSPPLPPPLELPSYPPPTPTYSSHLHFLASLMARESASLHTPDTEVGTGDLRSLEREIESPRLETQRQSSSAMSMSVTFSLVARLRVGLIEEVREKRTSPRDSEEASKAILKRGGRWRE